VKSGLSFGKVVFRLKTLIHLHTKSGLCFEKWFSAKNDYRKVVNFFETGFSIKNVHTLV
jgi:hypothetical protein